MPTTGQLKTQFDTEIRQQTAPNSINPDRIADQLDALADHIQGTRQTLTDGATVTMNVANGRNAVLTIAGNRTVAFSNLTANDAGIIEVVQDGTGGRTLSWPGNAVLPTGGLALSAGAGERTLIGYYFNGTSIFLMKENYGVVAGDTTPPTIVSRVVNNANPNQMVLTFSESVAATIAGFSARRNTNNWVINSISGSGTTWTLTMATNAVAGETLDLSYNSGTGNTLDGAGNELASFTNASVTNNVGGGPVLEDIIFSPQTGLTNSSGVWSGANGGWGTNVGIGTKKIASGTNGYIQLEYLSTEGPSAILGFSTVNNDYTTGYPAMEAGMYVEAAGLIYHVNNGTIQGLTDTVNDGNLIRVNRVGSTVTLERSTNGGTSWSVLRTFGFSSSADLFVICDINSTTGRLKQPKIFNGVTA